MMSEKLPENQKTVGNYQSITDNMIEWVRNAEIIRLPVRPGIIFKVHPNDFVESPSESVYNNYFNCAFTGGKRETCPSNVPGELPYRGFESGTESPWWNGNYMDALIKLTNQEKFVIVDLHDNTHHLCGVCGSTDVCECRTPCEPGAFNPGTPGPMITGPQFAIMWKHLSKYIIDNVPNHEYVLFELFNEPVEDECPESESINNESWVKNYVVPSINSIRKLEESKDSIPHYIIATTWGDWSGVHSWTDKPPGNTRLSQLVDIIRSNFGNSSKDTHILIGGHQYCDSQGPYAGYGIGKGCDNLDFNENNITRWLTTLNDQLGEFKWIYTEGNITCSINNECERREIYGKWLKALMGNEPSIPVDSKCVGATLWFSMDAAFGNGDNFMGNYNTDLAPNMFPKYAAFLQPDQMEQSKGYYYNNWKNTIITENIDPEPPAACRPGWEPECKEVVCNVNTQTPGDENQCCQSGSPCWGGQICCGNQMCAGGVCTDATKLTIEKLIAMGSGTGGRPPLSAMRYSN